MGKKYKTFEQQILLLEKRGLEIKNRSKFQWYIRCNNYQNFINAYNDPFMQNFTRSTNLYRGDASDLAIIDLFNFDRSLSSIMLSNIKEIEVKFNSAITYEIGKELFNLGEEEGRILEFIKNNPNNRRIFQKDTNIEKMREELIGNFNKSKSSLKKKYAFDKKIEDVPIWTLSVFWTFGNAISIYKKLDTKIKNNIIDEYFNGIFDDSDELLKIFAWLKTIRNASCHNNVIYNLSVKNNASKFFDLLDEVPLTKHPRVKIFDVVRIIDVILGKEGKDRSLENQFDKKFKKIIVDQENISIESIKYIKNLMNYKK